MTIVQFAAFGAQDRGTPLAAGSMKPSMLAPFCSACVASRGSSHSLSKLGLVASKLQFAEKAFLA